MSFQKLYLLHTVEQEKNAHAVTDFLTSFSIFFDYFGCALQRFQDSGGSVVFPELDDVLSDCKILTRDCITESFSKSVWRKFPFETEKFSDMDNAYFCVLRRVFSDSLMAWIYENEYLQLVFDCAFAEFKADLHIQQLLSEQ